MSDLRFRLVVVLLALSCGSLTHERVSRPAIAQESVADDPAEGNLPADWSARIARLEDRLEEQRRKLNIPGMAIAVVRDGEVVLCRGFGHQDLAAEKTVNEQTLFAIGSSTKAFTTALLGMLVDEGKLAWDDPVTNHIPEFELQVQTGDEQVTIRDLLCHRTGYTRMGLLWAGGTATRPEVIGYAASAEPLEKFREKFQYNNVMYMIAGHAAGRAADSTWESLIAERIFEPLGMSSSSTSIAVVQDDPRLSVGYRWDEDAEEHKVLPMRNLDLIGPAGSINSNIRDMARWVAFQLARGEIDGRPLLDSATLQETWKPQMEIAPGSVDYGLGWMLRKWNGRQVVEHGGNIDGFAAQVSLLPEENLGYVLLTNISFTPLQAGSVDVVFDSLLGEVPENDESAEPASRPDMSQLTGDYEGSMGAIRDKTLKVLVQDGNLAIDVPDQMVYELKDPDDEGKWYFALTDQIAVSFDVGSDGQATSLTMHQAGFSIECPRAGIEREPDVPLDRIRPLLGTFHDPDNEVDVKFIIYKNRLAVDAGEQGLVEFLPPDQNGHWAMRANPDAFQIRFERGDDGNVEAVTRIRDKKETRMPRVEDTADAASELPTATEVLQRMQEAVNVDDNAAIGHVQMEGNVNFVHQGATGTARLVFSNSGGYQTNIDLAELGYIRESSDGQNGWIDSSLTPFEQLSGDRLAMLKMRHPLWMLADWQSRFEALDVLEETEIDGQPAWKILFRDNELPNRTLYVNVDSGLVVKEDWAVILPGIGRMPVSMKYRDYRPVAGYMLPFSIDAENPANGRTEFRYESAESLRQAPNYELTGPDNR